LNEKSRELTRNSTDAESAQVQTEGEAS